MRFCQAFAIGAVPPRWPRYRCARRRHRRGWPRSGLHRRHVQKAGQQRLQRVHRQGPELWRLADPPRSHRLRHRVLRRRKCWPPVANRLPARPCRCPARATWRSTPWKKPCNWAPRWSTVSDSGGTVYDAAGFTPEKLAILMQIKNEQYGRVSEYAAKVGAAVPGRQSPLAHRRGHRPALRHPKRTGRERRPDPHPKRCGLRGRRRQHALHQRSGQGL